MSVPALSRCTFGDLTRLARPVADSDSTFCPKQVYVLRRPYVSSDFLYRKSLTWGHHLSIILTPWNDSNLINSECLPGRGHARFLWVLEWMVFILYVLLALILHSNGCPYYRCWGWVEGRANHVTILSKIQTRSWWGPSGHSHPWWRQILEHHIVAISSLLRKRGVGEENMRFALSWGTYYSRGASGRWSLYVWSKTPHAHCAVLL